MTATTHLRTLGLLVVLMLALAACGGDDATASGDDGAVSEMPSEPMVEESDMASEPAMVESEMDSMASSDCELEPLPDEGDGSVDTMAAQPAATAASGNPNLTTLVTAVQEAELVDTLNGAGPFTIFAPADCAFEDIAEEDLGALLADTDQLTSVLTFHVIDTVLIPGS